MSLNPGLNPGGVGDEKVNPGLGSPDDNKGGNGNPGSNQGDEKKNPGKKQDEKRGRKLKPVGIAQMQWLAKITTLKNAAGWKAYKHKIGAILRNLNLMDAFNVVVGNKIVNTFKTRIGEEF